MNTSHTLFVSLFLLAANLKVALVTDPQHVSTKAAFRPWSRTNSSRHCLISCPGLSLIGYTDIPAYIQNLHYIHVRVEIQTIYFFKGQIWLTSKHFCTHLVRGNWFWCHNRFLSTPYLQNWIVWLLNIQTQVKFDLVF